MPSIEQPDDKHSFPLFNILYTNTANKIETIKSSDLVKQLKELNNKDIKYRESKTINNSLPRAIDICYALIRMYALKHDNCKILDLPFKSRKITEKVVGNDILTDISVDF